MLQTSVIFGKCVCWMCETQCVCNRMIVTVKNLIRVMMTTTMTKKTTRKTWKMMYLKSVLTMKVIIGNPAAVNRVMLHLLVL